LYFIFNLCSKIVFLYVSLMNIVGVKVTVVRKSNVHRVQRQPFAEAVNPPNNGPIAGPMKGVMTYKAIGTARWAGGQVSVMVALPMARPGEPAKPARKRQTMTPAMVGESPAPRINKAKTGIEER
jgi:hypothetical protein